MSVNAIDPRAAPVDVLPTPRREVLAASRAASGEVECAAGIDAVVGTPEVLFQGPVRG